LDLLVEELNSMNLLKQWKCLWHITQVLGF
jgi:hypothetical protein